MLVHKLLAPKFGGVRTGGRSARVVDQVLTTTIKLLGESGYGALRIDEVAARSGVNKTTIYRRWPTKAQLAGAALRRYHVHAPAPDTGDLVRDLVAMFVASLSTVDVGLTRGLMRMTLLEQHDAELEAIRGELRERIIDARKVRIELAVARGELPPGTDVLLVVSLLSSTIYTRLLAYAEPPSPEMIADIVAIVIRGARGHWDGAPALARTAMPVACVPLAPAKPKTRPKTRTKARTKTPAKPTAYRRAR